MNIIQLPVISGSTRLDEVLSIMKTNLREAVVIDDINGMRLVTVEQVVREIREGSQIGTGTAGNIKSLKQPTFLPESNEKLKAFSPIHSSAHIIGKSASKEVNVSVGMAEALTKGPGSYAILSMLENQALIANDDQEIDQYLNKMIIICRCKKEPDKHVWMPFELHRPGICNMDDFEVNCG